MGILPPHSSVVSSPVEKEEEGVVVRVGVVVVVVVVEEEEEEGEEGEGEGEGKEAGHRPALPHPLKNSKWASSLQSTVSNFMGISPRGGTVSSRLQLIRWGPLALHHPFVPRWLPPCAWIGAYSLELRS